MTQLHQQIYTDFVTKIGQPDTTFAQSHGSMHTLGFEDFCSYMFQNWTASNPTFKLTNIGFVILSRMYQHWEFDIRTQPANLLHIPNIQVFIFRHLKSPYYGDHSKFYVFDSEKAMELDMAGGDLKLWCEMFA